MNTGLAKALGLTWYPQWSSAGEGPYTLCAKLAAANPLSARTLRRMLLNVQSTSNLNQGVTANTFLSSRWMQRGARICAWSHSLSLSTLDATLGDWAPRLADDRHLRYCPVCLVAGFQSALCQIDAFTRCPIHDCEFVTECRHCGGSTPAYGWNDTLDESMSCNNCSLPLSDAWSPRNTLRWRALPEAAAYVDLAARLSAFRVAEWVDAEGWAARYGSPEHQQSRRRTEFALLASAVSLPPCRTSFDIRHATPEHLTLELVQTTAVKITQAMREIYSSFCTKISPSKGQAEADESIACFLTFRHRVFKFDDLMDPCRLAYILFRRRFEVIETRTSPAGLSDRFLNESLKGLVGTFSANLPAWKRFLAMCFEAELRYCQLLQESTHGLAPGEPRWMQAVATHSAALSPLMLRLPYGLGILRMRRDAEAMVVIAIAERRSDPRSEAVRQSP